jgi:hypothetical protein
LSDDVGGVDPAGEGLHRASGQGDGMVDLGPVPA